MRKIVWAAPIRRAITIILLAVAAATSVYCGPSVEPPGAEAVAEPWAPLEDTNSSAGPPNVIVILADDLGYGDAGFNGSADARTPNLDRLATEGVRFTNGYVAHLSVARPGRRL